MTGEPNPSEPAEAVEDYGARRPRSTLKHIDIIGAEATSRNSPLRWLLLLVPILLIALGLAYLASQWSASLLEIAEPLRTREQRPAPPDRAQRPAQPDAKRRPAQTESGGVGSSDDGFDVDVVLALLPRADPGAGANAFKMCAVCHTDERGAPHRVGNNLWNIIGSPKAARPDYRYSQALRAIGGTWSYQELAEYLHNPRASVPGTSMAFAGIRDNERMANLLSYMRTRADRPAPLPN